MREGSVFEPLDERRKTIDYDKKLQERRSKRMLTSCAVLEEKVTKLEERLSKLENIIEEYRQSEIERLKAENKAIMQQMCCEFKGWE